MIQENNKKFVVGDEVDTVWGSGYVNSIRSEDDMYVVLLDKWQLAQGQSPTLFLEESALRRRERQEEEDEEDEEDDFDDEVPSLMRHLTIEDDNLPPLPNMIRLASHNAAKEKKCCCICNELVLHGRGHLRLGCKCLCHENCFIDYIRSKSRSDWGRAGGIACPYALGADMCSFKDLNNEPYRITPNDLHQMIKVLGNADRDSAISDDFVSESFITLEEIEKYEKWILEFQQSGNTLVDGTENDAIFTSNDGATKIFIEATTKACPQCGLRATHYHGHSCHHIYGGCEGCNEEYCYRCLSTATENSEKRGDRTCCPCGSWETFCNNEDLEFFLVCKPYPHDTRCGCSICPECRPGDPCDMCDGCCVVCDGIIEPAPLDLDNLDDWEHNCSSEDLPPGAVYITGAMIHTVNGIFLPDSISNDESNTSMFSYTKKIYDDDDREEVMLVCGQHEGAYCWRIEGEKGGIAHVKMNPDDLKLPGRDKMDYPWHVKINGVYQERSEVNMQLVQPDIDIPTEMVNHFERGKAEIERQHADYLAELSRDPFPGSVNVTGFTSPNDEFNGIYEPSSDILNGLSVYHQKGNKAFALEFAHDSLGCTWRVRKGENPILAFEARREVCSEGENKEEQVKYIPMEAVFLPHNQEARDSAWLVIDEFGNCSCSDVKVAMIYPSEVTPQGLVEELEGARSKCDEDIKQQQSEMSREAIEGSLTISFSNLGQGLCEVPINEFMSAGTYEPTSTFEHELPVYEKKGDKNVKMKACFNTWEIRALIVANQHDYSNVIAKGCAFDDNILPVQLDASRWKFKHGFDFGASKECLVTPTSKTYLPPDIFSQLSENRKSKLRDPLPGSVVIKGATGSRAGRVNGIFEPTEEVYNDMPVYRKKGDDGIWIELVTGTSGGLRWYIKPTENRGSSSVCFGYLDEDSSNLTLPHDTGEMSWYVYDGASFVPQQSVQSLLYNAEDPVPNNMLQLLEARREVLEREVAEKEALMSRPCVPGSVLVEGATGSRAYGVNGFYEPTEEMYNGLPCYKKKGEAIWIEMVHGASGYRWYIKPEANRGSSSVCFAYCKFDEFNPTLPFDREKDKWLVYDGKEFKTQDTVVSKVEPPDVPVPEHHWELLEMVKNDLALKHQKRKEKLARPPKPGSVTLSGATGSRAHRVNGTFEPTDEVQNDMPVYQMKEDDDIWLELVHGTSGWRWYIKPTKEKGPSNNVCFAYKNVAQTNVNLPQNCTENGWNVYGGSAFAVQDSVTCVLNPNTEPIPEKMLNMVEAKKIPPPPPSEAYKDMFGDNKNDY